MIIYLIAVLASISMASDTIKISQGYVYKLRCEGRLFVSAVGDEKLVRLEALPKEIGCGAIVKATASLGTTNVIFETSTGMFSRVIEVTEHGVTPKNTEVFIGSEK